MKANDIKLIDYERLLNELTMIDFVCLYERPFDSENELDHKNYNELKRLKDIWLTKFLVKEIIHK